MANVTTGIIIIARLAIESIRTLRSKFINELIQQCWKSYNLIAKPVLYRVSRSRVRVNNVFTFVYHGGGCAVCSNRSGEFQFLLMRRRLRHAHLFFRARTSFLEQTAYRKFVNCTYPSIPLPSYFFTACLLVVRVLRVIHTNVAL